MHRRGKESALMCPAIPPLQGTPEPELTKILTCPTEVGQRRGQLYFS